MARTISSFAISIFLLVIAKKNKIMQVNTVHTSDPMLADSGKVLWVTIFQNYKDWLKRRTACLKMAHCLFLLFTLAYEHSNCVQVTHKN